MSANELLVLLIQALFILLAVVTAADWLRHRGEIRRDIALLFGSLGLVFLIQVLENISDTESPVVESIEQFALLAHPYLLLRLLRYFRPVPQNLMRIALAGLLLNWVFLILFRETQSGILLVFVIAYLVGINGYCMFGFVRGALTTSGTVRQRMRFAAFGSGLFGLTLGLLGIMIFIPSLAGVGIVVDALIAIASVLCFYIGFTPPRWLRRTWQMDEIRSFLMQMTSKTADERLTTAESLNNLCSAALHAVGGFAAAVVEEADGEWVVRYSTDPVLENIGTDGAKLFSRAWQQRVPTTVQLLPKPNTSEGHLHETVGAKLMFLVPIVTAERDWGLLVVFMRYGSLFIDDDLNILALLAQQNATLLENSLLMDQLRAHSQRLEKVVEERTALLESAPDAMIIVNGQAKIERVNAQTEKVFGYTRDELLGQPIEMLMPETFRSRHRAHRDGYIAEPRVRAMGVGLELFALRKDGSQFPVEVSLSPIQTDDGIAVISAVRDITDRKRLEEIHNLNVELERRVRERTAQLEAINKELESFSYSVSHDLRAPLRTLDGFSQALLEDYADKLDETGQNLLNRIRAASQRMGQLIDDLLQLSRLSRSEMRITEVNLSEMAQEILNELQEQNPTREVKSIVADGLVVRGDLRLLRVALSNLLGNAWKFTSKQPEACIEFGVTERDGKPVYFVRDNGAGFDMAYAGKLFGAFQRLHRMNEFEGTGIGLATVQRVLLRHGGSIWAEAAVNEGATFYFTL